jgi:tetratricopeptide (TPR) repeat protein
MMNDEELQRVKDLQTTSVWIFAALLFGLAIVVLRFVIASAYSIHQGHPWVVQGHVFTSLMWATGWFAAAFVFGFLFGVPKVLQTKTDANSTNAAKTNDSNGKDTPYQLRVNTNLEDISDWLTKILVGATLTQLVKIPALIKSAATYMSIGLVEPTYQAFAASIIVYFSSLGFLSGYVLTRMFFSRAFGRSDQPFSPADIQVLHSATIALGSQVSTPREVQQVADRSRSIGITDLLSGPEANNIATAANIVGDTKKALEAAKFAVFKSPADPRSHLNYAVALYNVSPTDPAIMEELEKARSLVRPDLDPRTTEDIYSSIVFLALYLPPPAGFTKAIEYGESFVQHAEPRDASIWINLACAYGQQYKWIKEKGSAAEKANLPSLREKALQAVKKAIDLDPGVKTRLAELCHGTGRDPGDDDLKIFENDPDFEKLIG